MTAGAGLASYDHIKQFLLASTSLQDSSTTHALTTVLSSFISVSCACPFDIVKTRIMNQSLVAPIYRSTWHCLSSTIQNEGVFSIYKGFVPSYTRVFPWQCIFFVSYEKISKTLIGETL